MHDKLQPYELDKLWCVEECKRNGLKVPSDDKLDAFAEKVAYKMSHCVYKAGAAEKLARWEAFNEMIEGRLK